MNPKSTMEPYKIKSIDPIHWTTREYRRSALLKAHLNLFLLPSKDVMIDLLTDSGTGAMSSHQWGALMQGDEAYAGSESFFLFEKTIKDITGMPFIIPTHQGRSAERIILHHLKSKGEYIISNTLFDTTRANSEDFGFKVLDIPCPEFFQNSEYHPFKGNIDLPALDKHLKEKSTAGVIVTVTNNSGGGQPVSMENLKTTKQICKKHSVPLILDACRFAENAWFIKQREKDFKNQTVKQIARTLFDTVDCCFVSAKKDGLANTGGFICVREESPSEHYKNRLILTEGFPSYGGMARRDMSAIAIGLQEVLEESYLHHRISFVEQLYKKLDEGKIPMINPPGGHAIYIDAKKLFPHIPVSAYPGQAFAAGLYEYSGIRSCEIGSVMFGKTLKNGEKTYHSKELVRLCLPRRVYTQSHLDFVAEAVIAFVQKEAPKLKGVQFTKEPPFLRHFTGHFAWL